MFEDFGEYQRQMSLELQNAKMRKCTLTLSVSFETRTQLVLFVSKTANVSPTAGQ